jgi:hypothetical protein
MQALAELETQISLARAAAASAGYALFLEQLKGTYAPRWTWLVATFGIAMTGGLVATRFTGTIPNLPPRRLVWWAWSQVHLHFWATGIPIITWQIWKDARDREQAHGDLYAA